MSGFDDLRVLFEKAMEKAKCEIITEAEIKFHDRIVDLLSKYCVLFRDVGVSLDLNEKFQNLVLDRSVDSLELSVRASNVLRKHNVNTIRDLVAMSDVEILQLKNGGRKTIREITDELFRFGLKLRPHNIEASNQ